MKSKLLMKIRNIFLRQKHVENDKNDEIYKLLRRLYHEITLPTIFIRDNLSELLNNKSEFNNSDLSTKKSLLNIETSVERINTIISASLYHYQLANFADINKKKFINLNVLIEVCLIIIENKNYGYSKNRFIVDYGRNCNIFCNPPEIIQIIKNVIINAIEATTNNNGRIYIKSRRILKEKKANSIIKLEIVDNGIAIPQDILQNIRTNGYSTKICIKREYGLSVVKDILDKNGGKIHIESPTFYPPFRSNDKKGTKITIEFVSAG